MFILVSTVLVTHLVRLFVGVYLAKDGQISMGHYAGGNSTMWRKSKICPNACVALAEVVNLPEKFVSSNPYFVIADTTWIVW